MLQLQDDVTQRAAYCAQRTWGALEPQLIVEASARWAISSWCSPRWTTGGARAPPPGPASGPRACARASVAKKAVRMTAEARSGCAARARCFTDAGLACW